MSSDLVSIISAILMLVVAAIFVSAEAAFGALSRSRAEEVSRERATRGAARLVDVAEDRSRYVNTAILLHTLCTTAAIIVAAEVLYTSWKDLGSWAMLATVALLSAVVFIALGVAPRTIGRQRAVEVSLIMAGPVRLLSKIFGPITRLMILIGNAITPGKGYRQGPFSSQAELRELVDIAEADRLIEDSEAAMIQSVFDLGDTLVREIMVPRTEMIWIEETKTLRQCLSLCLRSGFSRVPVIREDPDDVVGVIYMKDVARRIYEHRGAEQSERVASLMRPAHFVPDSLLVDDLLRQMRTSRVHMAIAVDEYGGTAGLVTIEDVLEEIVGEIVDEHDDAELPEVEELTPDSYRLSARMHVEDAGELLGFDIDAEDEGVDTIGGLLAKVLGKMPIPGSHIQHEGWLLTAERPHGRRRRIATVLATREGAEESPTQETEGAVNG